MRFWGPNHSGFLAHVRLHLLLVSPLDDEGFLFDQSLEKLKPKFRTYTLGVVIASASRFHVAHNLFDKTPDRVQENNTSLLFESGDWQERAKVRKLMEERKVKKEAGYSWIEVKNKTYAFLAGDRWTMKRNYFVYIFKTGQRVLSLGQIENKRSRMHVATGGVLSVSTATLLLRMTPWEGNNLAATYS
ncbi:hypothetical protein F2Q69_00062880 [Brassica cretica]|uniref:Uncharacterized protein n=1 Tax=Brassica cretica TaxID=69181 RepID=A0A8S9RCP0_BRACR|nr:hypothetical protein F2Q69_00062880 [Brassica cretica]